MVRLDKWIATTCGLTRKAVREQIRSGQVLLNGAAVFDPGQYVDPETDVLTVDGKRYDAQAHAYLMLHKPLGVVSATNDRTQKTVLDLVPPQLYRKGLFPAGRLDKDTSGFVLLTDDGAFAHRILSPKQHVQKTYVASLSAPLSPAGAEALRTGLTLRDGTALLPARVRILDDEQKSVEIGIWEGKYHQIRRMLAAVGSPVETLMRTQIGALSLDASLAPGECRALTPEEVREIEKR